MKLGSQLRGALWSLSLGLVVAFSGLSLTACQSSDKGEKGDELGAEEGAAPEEEGDKKKAKKAGKKKDHKGKKKKPEEKK